MDTDDRLRGWLTWVLAIALILSIAGVVSVAIDPPETTDPFTEFYVLGPGGNASGYPTTLAPGESGTVILGISNHEHEPVSYRVDITWNGTMSQSLDFALADDETVEHRVALTAPETSGRYRVRFLLFKGDQRSEPAKALRLWILVTET